MKIKISTRVVFLIGKYAIKIPIDRRGYLQGKNEGELYKKYKRYPYLAPLVWEKFGIVCQKRCRELSPFETKYMHKSVKKLKEKIPELNIDNCDLWNKDNWGWYEYSMVLLDYGIDEKISKMY